MSPVVEGDCVLKSEVWSMNQGKECCNQKKVGMRGFFFSPENKGNKGTVNRLEKKHKQA